MSSASASYHACSSHATRERCRRRGRHGLKNVRDSMRGRSTAARRQSARRGAVRVENSGTEAAAACMMFRGREAM